MITIDHMKKEEQKKKTEEGRAEIRRERMERRRVHERYVLLDSSFFLGKLGFGFSPYLPKR